MVYTNSFADLLLSFRLEADESLESLLPRHWERYFRKDDYSQYDTILRVKVNEFLNETVCATGWSLCELEGKKHAFFAPKGKASFCLTYDESLSEVTVSLRKALDSYVRIGVMYGMLTAFSTVCIGLHGVTLQCNGETIILSAPSGTGKTTLANLLVKYCGARVINGDFAMLSSAEEGVHFEPTPFCGTSGICLDERVRIDRIVFLSQSRVNQWQELAGRQAFMNLSNNTFVPVFDGQLQHNVQKNIIRVLSNVRTSGYAFAPTEEAANQFLDGIQQG